MRESIERQYKFLTPCSVGEGEPHIGGGVNLIHCLFIFVLWVFFWGDVFFAGVGGGVNSPEDIAGIPTDREMIYFVP